MSDLDKRLLVERRQRQDSLNRQAALRAKPPLPPVAPQPGTCARHQEALLLWDSAILPLATEEMQTRPDGPWVPVCSSCASSIRDAISRFGGGVVFRGRKP